MPDLGIGNFASVIRMVERVGGRARLVDAPDAVRRADKLILAGVGAFDVAMRSLGKAGWSEALSEAALARRVPVLGICLGMQLMCGSSEEGVVQGLGWLDADVKRLDVPRDARLKVPHMGWNTVTVERPNALLAQNGAALRFYFVHSYHAVSHNRQDVVATAWHGSPFTAALEKDNLYGVQFHPEKSHRFGLELMRRFVEL